MSFFATLSKRLAEMAEELGMNCSPGNVLRKFIMHYETLFTGQSFGKWVFAVLLAALLVNFAGVRMKRVSLTMVVYSMFHAGAGQLKTVLDGVSLIDAGPLKKNVVEVSRSVMDKMQNNKFFALFLCIALGMLAFFFLKAVLYVSIIALVFYIWKALEAKLGGELGNPYYICQAIMLCLGLLTLVLVKHAVFIACIVLFSMFGSLFIMISAKVAFELNIDIIGGFDLFISNGLSSDSVVAMAYGALVTLGMISQMFLINGKE